MVKWKSRGGKSQRGEEKKWEDPRRERERRKKMQVHKKVGKSRFTVFFQWFVALGGRKVTSLKRRVRSQLARWEMKNCTPLWREAHFQVKMYKAEGFSPLLEVEMSKKCTLLWREAHFQHVRTTFRSWDVAKVDAVVARSIFPSQKGKNLKGLDHFWTFKCRKKVRAIVARSAFGSQKCQKCQKLRVLSLFWRSDVEKVRTNQLNKA